MPPIQTRSTTAMARTLSEMLISYPLSDSVIAAVIGQGKRRRNDMDDAVLSSLTHEHLKELGVASLGHHVKLPNAVAALRVDASIAFSAPRGAVGDRTERRQVQACELSAPIYSWFTEAVDTCDLKEAKELFEDLVA
jgi:hypothetical protein